MTLIQMQTQRALVFVALTMLGSISAACGNGDSELADARISGIADASNDAMSQRDASIDAVRAQDAAAPTTDAVSFADAMPISDSIAAFDAANIADGAATIVDSASGPSLVITATPSDPSSNPWPAFSFTASYDATFTCDVVDSNDPSSDPGASPCSSGWSFSDGLGASSYTFTVTATNQSGATQ